MRQVYTISDDVFQKSKLPQPDIYIVGAGIRIPQQFTLEALDALSACLEIYAILHLSKEASLPLELATKIRSLWSFYKHGASRRQVYNLEISTVLDAPIQQKPVAYLTPGNPVIFDCVMHGILKGAQDRNLAVHMIPGISSIDSILVDLWREIAPGLQIFVASFLIAKKIILRPDIPCLLMQSTAFCTNYITVGYQPLAATYAPLREYLISFYPGEHELMYITSAVRKHHKAEITRFLLRDFGGTEDQPQTPGASLFIPPIQNSEVDLEFLARMADSESFHRDYHPHPRSTNEDAHEDQRSDANPVDQTCRNAKT